MKYERGDSITTKELKKHLKISNRDFANMIGISEVSLYYREKGSYEWTLPELVKLCEMSGGSITVSSGGHQYDVSIRTVQMDSDFA